MVIIYYVAVTLTKPLGQRGCRAIIDTSIIYHLPLFHSLMLTGSLTTPETP